MPASYLKALYVAALVAATALLPAMAQDYLPPGPGRDVTIKACSECHGIELIQGLRRNREQWETTISNMMSAGMAISDEDFEIVATYLIDNLGLVPRPAP
jgi:mono/diheme cytochrome c family protein